MILTGIPITPSKQQNSPSETYEVSQAGLLLVGVAHIMNEIVRTAGDTFAVLLAKQTVVMAAAGAVLGPLCDAQHSR